MMHTAGNDVVGVQQRLPCQTFDVLVVEGVEDAVAVAAHLYQLGQAELGQMLGHRRRASTDVVGELVDGVLAMQQRPDDPQAGRVGQELDRKAHV